MQNESEDTRQGREGGSKGEHASQVSVTQKTSVSSPTACQRETAPCPRARSVQQRMTRRTGKGGGNVLYLMLETNRSFSSRWEDVGTLTSRNVRNAFFFVLASLLIWSTRCIRGQVQCYIVKLTFTKKCTVFEVHS